MKASIIYDSETLIIKGLYLLIILLNCLNIFVIIAMTFERIFCSFI